MKVLIMLIVIGKKLKIKVPSIYYKFNEKCKYWVDEKVIEFSAPTFILSFFHSLKFIIVFF